MSDPIPPFDLDEVLEQALGGEKTPPSHPEAARAYWQARNALDIVDATEAVEPPSRLRPKVWARLSAEDARRQRWSWMRLGGGLSLAGACAAAFLLWAGAPAEPEWTMAERLDVAEHRELYENLDLLEHLDVLEDLSVIEDLPEESG